MFPFTRKSKIGKNLVFVFLLNNPCENDIIILHEILVVDFKTFTPIN